MNGNGTRSHKAFTPKIVRITQVMSAAENCDFNAFIVVNLDTFIVRKFYKIMNRLDKRSDCTFFLQSDL